VAGVAPASAQEKKPNIVLLMTDDTGWNRPSAWIWSLVRIPSRGPAPSAGGSRPSCGGRPRGAERAAPAA
jgi:hypothetical protein